MSQPGTDAARDPPGPLSREVPRWLEGLKRWLYPYRPRFRDWRFWAVQGLILVVAGVHTTLEVLRYKGHTVFVGSGPEVVLLSFVPVSLFFVPVVYAALNFGFAGSVATAVWCTFLTIPNIFLHPGMERVRELSQLGIVDAIAVFVGQRVDREISARRLAQGAEAALRASETKYRGLFESTPLAILVVDPAGMVLEANPAAGALFGKPSSGPNGLNLVDLVGTAGAERLLNVLHDPKSAEAHLALTSASGAAVYLEPTLTPISDPQVGPAIQVLLRDVTGERQRHAGLRTYAAYVLRAQEEERQRIAQELHDEAVQALVLLCRRLDTVESANWPLSSAVTDGLREARRAAEHVAQGLRDFARALRPPILEDLGLVTSLRRLLVDLAERAHLEGRLKVEGKERRLPPDVELGLFRIAQEALRNVERHASAARVTMTLGFAEHAATLGVLDDGVGFALPSIEEDFAARGQLGLLGMQERAELLGGRLVIDSAPGHGTRVTGSIPI